MILDKLIEEIQVARKEKNSTRENALKNLMSELTRVKTSDKPEKYTDEVETKEIIKYISTLEKAIVQFNSQNRSDLAESYNSELLIVKDFAPQEPTDSDVIAYTNEVIDDFGNNGISLSIKTVMAEVKKKYPTANSKMIVGIIQASLKS